jgi:hypothetical protein
LRNADSLSLTISIIGLVTSLLAFAVSAAAFYFNLLRKADLEIVVGDSISFSADQEGYLQLVAEFTLINKGALPGALVRLQGSISTKDGSRVAGLRWDAFIDSKDIGKPGETFKPYQVYAGSAEAISLPGRSTVSEGISLLTEDSFDLVEGDYVIDFVGLEGPKRRALPKVQYSIHLSSQQVQYLREKCTANAEGVFEDSLRVTWNL